MHLSLALNYWITEGVGGTKRKWKIGNYHSERGEIALIANWLPINRATCKQNTGTQFVAHARGAANFKLAMVPREIPTKLIILNLCESLPLSPFKAHYATNWFIQSERLKRFATLAPTFSISTRKKKKKTGKKVFGLMCTSLVFSEEQNKTIMFLLKKMQDCSTVNKSRWFTTARRWRKIYFFFTLWPQTNWSWSWLTF